ncbi:MAG: methyltransferase [Limnohabitans sp.]|nr:methyltransferase [Limnohabitans sp.]
MALLFGFSAWAALAQTQDARVFEPLLSLKHRSSFNVVRDLYRHPAQTLAFFGVQRNSTVIEILPGSSAYYLEILAPWMRGHGRYIAANRDESLPQYVPDHLKLLERLKAQPDLYDQVLVTPFRSNFHSIAPPNSVDFVISFRNLHNWMERKELTESLQTFHQALKKGGVLGIVDHRGRTDLSQEQQVSMGYVRQDIAIALIEAQGFQLVGVSEVNSNPKDTKDHPEGVWTLPPTFRMKDVDRSKYEAIGESDRFTLKFVKK